MSDQNAVSYEDSELYRIRHSAAHIMAEAVLELSPGQAKIAIGPPIADGFYYDFELPRALTPEDLAAIEKRMNRIRAANLPFLRDRWPREKALQYFGDKGQTFKVEIIENLPDA